MGLTNYNKERPILLTGKHGTGKSTKAKTFVNDPIVMYANDIDFDVGSFPIERGIIIEDVHYKANKDIIMDVIRHCKSKHWHVSSLSGSSYTKCCSMNTSRSTRVKKCWCR